MEECSFLGVHKVPRGTILKFMIAALNYGQFLVIFHDFTELELDTSECAVVDTRLCVRA